MILNGRYKVLDVIGSGSHATVLQVQDSEGQHGHRTLALKLLHDDHPSELLRWEFEQLRRLEHPNIARVHHLDTVVRVEGMGPVEVEEQALFVTQDFIEGHTADKAVVAAVELGESRELWVVRVAAELCRALAFLHDRGVIHRDIKPANVIVVNDPLRVCLIDLSLSRQAREIGEYSSTLTHGAAGSIAYMAPEALAGAAEPRSDLFALGVTLYQLLTNSLPFGDSKCTIASLIRSIMSGNFRRVTDSVSIEPGLNELITSLLARDPTARPRTATDVLYELGRLFGPDRIGVTAGPAGVVDLGEGEPLSFRERVALGRRGVLVGRDAELDKLSKLLDERLDPSRHCSQLVAVAGPAGVGKSALIREACQLLVLRTVAAEESPPLLISGSLRVIASKLRGAAGEDHVSPLLAEWLGEVSGQEEAPSARVSVESTIPDGAALHEELTSLFLTVVQLRPVVVHLIDGANPLTADLVASLHSRTEIEGLTSSRRWPLAVLTEIRVEPGESLPSYMKGMVVVEVPPLEERYIRRIVTDRLGFSRSSALPEELLMTAVKVARGRPLLLLAFFERLAASGLTDQVDSSTLAQVFATDLSADAAEVLQGALDALPKMERETLLALALWRRSASVSQIAYLLDISSNVAAQALGGLWQKGYIERIDGGAVDLVSPDLAPWAQKLAEPWVRAVHRRAFQLLSSADHPMAVLSDRARHAVAAGLERQGAELSYAAAISRLVSGDPESAIVHLETARALRADNRTAEALARAYAAVGRYGDAAQLWNELNPETYPEAPLEFARLLRLSGQRNEAIAAARQLLNNESKGLRNGALALLARLELDQGNARGALDILSQEDTDSAGAKDSAALEEVTGLAHLAHGETDTATTHFAACLRLAQQNENDSNQLARAHSLLGMVAHQRQQWAEAARHASAAESLARSAGLAHAAANYGVNVAAARKEAGELDLALLSLHPAVISLAGIGRGGELAGALYNLASLFYALNDLESGFRVHDRARAEASKEGARHIEAYCDLLLVDLLRKRKGQGDLENALEVAEQAVERFEALEAPHERSLAFLLRVEVLIAQGQTSDALTTLTQTKNLLTTTDSPELQARCALCRGRLALLNAVDHVQSTEELEAAVRHLGEGHHQDLRWRGELILGQLFLRGGDISRAADSFAAARTIVDEERRHVPERFRALWEAECDRSELSRQQQSLVSPPIKKGTAGQQLGADRSEDAQALRRLLGINKRLNSELRLGRLLDEIIDTIVELTDAERGFLLLRDRDSTLRPRSARNMDRRSLVTEELNLSRSIAEQVVASGEPVLTVDARADERFDRASSVHSLRLRSILAVPLRVKGEVVGAVYVDDRLRPGAFGDGALQLALDVADQAAIAIDNARLLNSNKRRQRKIEKLNRQLKSELDRQRVELDELRRELDGQRREMATKYSYDAIVSRSSAMTKVFRILDRVTDSEVPIVIQGESGTGKELVARAIHFNGPRSDRPFVTENCGAIPETLLESVLFGHVKGAFTGADKNRRGLFEVANGGTLLLDEISEMSVAMQAKLLRVLQESELRPVGGDRTVLVNVRIITSSNQDLGGLVKKGLFREDLYYRLNVITVRLPPLRDRAEDIPLLVDHFIAKHGSGRVVGVDRIALQKLSTSQWPGNVRQLENEIMRATVLADDIIREEHLSPELLETEAGQRPDDLDLRGHVAQLEKKLIIRALERYQGNQSQAANALGLSRFGLQKKMTRYELRAK